jgi:intraflagellar transport protein 20
VLNVEDVMNNLVEVLEGQGKKVEDAKLRALNIRNKVENEGEYRKQKVSELTNLINEKKTELEKYTIEYDSLQRVELEQKTLIQKLSNNEF